MSLALVPATSWTGIITAAGAGLTALAVLVSAVSAALVARRNSRRLDQYQRDTIGRLSVIHTLVNGTLTAALKDQRSAMNRELIVMHELIAVHAAAGTPPTFEQRESLAAIERRIADLDLAMAERAVQAKVAEMQAESERDRKSGEGAA